MDPVQKALWFVESHSRMGIDLEQVARASCVSQYHLTRAFAEVFGVSLMRYARSLAYRTANLVTRVVCSDVGLDLVP